jgi:CDP-diacylglycerol--serine O-phosphatidyltransferase
LRYVKSVANERRMVSFYGFNNVLGFSSGSLRLFGSFLRSRWGGFQPLRAVTSFPVGSSQQVASNASAARFPTRSSQRPKVRTFAFVKLKSQIPNFITLLNLFCGCAAIVNILDYQFIAAFWFLFAAGWFDFADGLVARLLKVSSEHGKELDSLADMVSFGAVPGVIYYTLLFIDQSAAPAAAPISWSWYAAPGLIVVLFSALRLAKFNLDTRQSENFMGVATPTSTVFATGLMLIYALDPFGWAVWTTSPLVLYPAIIAFSYLLVSEHPMFSFKIKGAKWAGNETRIIFAVLAIVFLAVLRTAAFPFIVGVYLIINLVAPPTAQANTSNE